MATNEYKCTNFAECDLALSKEPIEIEDGEDKLCPGCGKELAAGDSTKTAGSSGSRKRLIMAGGIAVLLALLVWVFWPVAPNPDLANSMLSDFFPKLPK